MQVGRIDSARAVLLSPHPPTLSRVKVFPGEHVAGRRAHIVAFAQFAQYHSHFCGPNGQKKNRHLVLPRSNAQAGWP